MDKLGLVAPEYRNATTLITNINTVALQAKEYLSVKNILLSIKDCEATTITSPILEKTIELASLCSSKVYIIHVAPASQQHPFNVDREMFRREVANELRHKHGCLQQIAKCMQDINISATALLLQGSIIDTILQESERLATDLVILGRHKHGPLYHSLLDNTDKGLLAKCSCPIMFVPI